MKFTRNLGLSLATIALASGLAGCSEKLPSREDYANSDPIINLAGFGTVALLDFDKDGNVDVIQEVEMPGKRYFVAPEFEKEYGKGKFGEMSKSLREQASKVLREFRELEYQANNARYNHFVGEQKWKQE